MCTGTDMLVTYTGCDDVARYAGGVSLCAAAKLARESCSELTLTDTPPRERPGMCILCKFKQVTGDEWDGVKNYNARMERQRRQQQQQQQSPSGKDDLFVFEP